MGKAPKIIVITGASSGIGRALALELAEPGVVLGLLGRQQYALAEVAALCRTKGALAKTGQVDVTDAIGLGLWMKAFDGEHPIDWVLANAGVTAAISSGGDLESIAQANGLLAVNLNGVLNTVYAVLPLMRERGRGQIGLMSSLAAWRGMALTPTYSASKAGVKAYGEALRDLLASEGIGVSVICPGFVETPMSEKFPRHRPQMIPAEAAAKKIVLGMKANKTYVAFPWSFILGLRLLNLLPFDLGSFFLRCLGLQPKR
jgi:short-subunit dehydrogenase